MTFNVEEIILTGDGMRNLTFSTVELSYCHADCDSVLHVYMYVMEKYWTLYCCLYNWKPRYKITFVIWLNYQFMIYGVD